MKSPVVKRSITIDGHLTSISVEDPFWEGLKEIAISRRMTVPALVGRIDAERKQSNLSSAVGLFVLDHYRSRPQKARGKSAGDRPAT